MSTLCKLQPKTLMLRKTGKVYRQSHIFGRSVKCTRAYQMYCHFGHYLELEIDTYLFQPVVKEFLIIRCILFSILSDPTMYWKLPLVIFRTTNQCKIYHWHNIFEMIFNNLFSMEKSLVTVNMAMRWEMRLKNSNHAKMMNHNEKQP